MLQLARFIHPPQQGLTSSHGHSCLRTTCQSVRTDDNGFEVDCSAHGEEDAVFIEYTLKRTFLNFSALNSGSMDLLGSDMLSQLLAQSF